ncbi:Retrovirus-related Pol polyprotein from transposon 17.6 [Dictyocoela roeselum]|nr:Retrovirus-related Pol polyprotein from transposon 17.6 [Dictyocoela roeselum]
MTHTFPKIMDCLSNLFGSTTFSQLDLNSGYYQIPLENNSIKYTAFTLCNNHYEFTKMPFGLMNAPMTFQKCMHGIFSELKFVEIYLDDILVHSKNEEEHLGHLEEVLKTLKQNNISLNFEKSKFLVQEVSYLGHVISKQGIKPSTEKLDKISEIKIKRKRDVQTILGIINWYRPFIANITEKCLFLTRKLRGNKNVQWTNEDSENLNTILNEIKARPVLTYPNINEPFDLFTDASEYAKGAILKQNSQTIGLFSRKLSRSESNYTIC